MEIEKAKRVADLYKKVGMETEEISFIEKFLESQTPFIMTIYASKPRETPESEWPVTLTTVVDDTDMAKRLITEVLEYRRKVLDVMMSELKEIEG